MTNHLRSGRWARFSARFDAVLMSAPVPPVQGPVTQPPAGCADADALLCTLQRLCPADASAERGFFSVGHTLAALPLARAQQQAWLQHQLLALDGTLHMLQLGGAGRQRLHRLAIKLQELLHSGPAAVALPWDCGWLHATLAAQAQTLRFMPRRPTLMVAWQLPPTALAPMLAALQQRSLTYVHPVRLWVLNAPTAAAWAAPQPL